MDQDINDLEIEDVVNEEVVPSRVVYVISMVSMQHFNDKFPLNGLS